MDLDFTLTSASDCKKVSASECAECLHEHYLHSGKDTTRKPSREGHLKVSREGGDLSFHKEFT